MNRKHRKELFLYCFMIALISATFGVVAGCVLKELISDNIIFSSVFIAIMGTALFAYSFLCYLCKGKFISAGNKKKFLKNGYWTFMMVLFLAYYFCHYKVFFQTYKQNSFGIDQEQYILLVNFGVFLCASIIIYYFIIRQFEIKELRIGTKGVELTVTEKLAESQKESLNINTSLIRTITDHICHIDGIINYLSTLNYVSSSIKLPEYTNILKSVLMPITKNYDGMSITVLLEEEFDSYMKKELGYRQREIEKIRSVIQKDEIYRYENDLFLEFELGEFHNYPDKVRIYIIIHVNELYADEAGQLIYTYLNVFEAIYSKYCLIKLIKEE